MSKYANVIIDITHDAVDKLFSYRIPDELQGNLEIGDAVIIPFGKGDSKRSAYVIEFTDEINFDESKIKSIISKEDKKTKLDDNLIKIAHFISTEYMVSMSLALKTVLPVKRSVQKNKRSTDISKNYEEEQFETQDSAQEKTKIVLNDEQKKISKDIIESCNRSEYSTHLIFGITGSGKTEVYMSIMNEVLNQGKQIIFLIPEISLTYQTIVRLSNKFKGRVAIIHSKMADGEKYIQYQKCKEGKVDIIVGPRSAIFAPFNNLGLIVIDEEHDHAYNSDTSPKYKASDVAKFRAWHSKCPLILGSATPSIRTYKEALDGKIILHKLTKRAVAGAELAKTHIVDLKEAEKIKHYPEFSKILFDKINEKLEKDEQVLLFMNRRGLSNFVCCRHCGTVIKCSHCDVALTLHNDSKLKCHYCGLEIPMPDKCPVCESTNISRVGIGTQKLEQDTLDLFESAKVIRMDSDSTIKKNSQDELIKKFKNKEAGILIGTQMIVKGHDFKDLTLVGIMLADSSLYIQDYKSSFETFALLTQCAGRSGRKMAGDCIIQTYDPDHYAIKYATHQDYEGFYNEEIKFRKALNYPPFSYMLFVRFSSFDEGFLMGYSDKLKNMLPPLMYANEQLIGPTDPAISKIKDEYKKILYIKTPLYQRAKELRKKIADMSYEMDKRNLVRLQFDIE